MNIAPVTCHVIGCDHDATTLTPAFEVRSGETTLALGLPICEPHLGELLELTGGDSFVPTEYVFSHGRARTPRRPRTRQRSTKT